LSSALSTAAGVAGGALLFEGVSSLFRGGMGYGSPFMGGGYGNAGFGNGGFGGQPIVNETVYETVNVYDQQAPTPPVNPDWSQADAGSAGADNSIFADNSDFGSSDFGGGDSGGGDDWA
jgi:hypothetical protein